MRELNLYEDDMATDDFEAIWLTTQTPGYWTNCRLAIMTFESKTTAWMLQLSVNTCDSCSYNVHKSSRALIWIYYNCSCIYNFAIMYEKKPETNNANNHESTNSCINGFCMYSQQGHADDSMVFVQFAPCACTWSCPRLLYRIRSKNKWNLDTSQITPHDFTFRTLHKHGSLSAYRRTQLLTFTVEKPGCNCELKVYHVAPSVLNPELLNWNSTNHALDLKFARILIFERQTLPEFYARKP